jgi:hypothetical protein
VFNVYNKIKSAKSRAVVSLSGPHEKANILSKDVGICNDENSENPKLLKKNKTVSKSCYKKALASKYVSKK